jgi:hypothetical protein
VGHARRPPRHTPSHRPTRRSSPSPRPSRRTQAKPPPADWSVAPRRSSADPARTTSPPACRLRFSGGSTASTGSTACDHDDRSRRSPLSTGTWCRAGVSPLPGSPAERVCCSCCCACCGSAGAARVHRGMLEQGAWSCRACGRAERRVGARLKARDEPRAVPVVLDADVRVRARHANERGFRVQTQVGGHPMPIQQVLRQGARHSRRPTGQIVQEVDHHHGRCVRVRLVQLEERAFNGQRVARGLSHAIASARSRGVSCACSG